MAIETFITNNGIKVTVDSIPHINTASVVILVGTGSGNGCEEENKFPGIAHVVEHMVFKGTKNLPEPSAIAESFDNLGGHFNAFTSRETTGYHARVLAENLPKAIGLFADMLQNSLFDKTELEKEKNVIIAEIKQYESDPDSLLSEALYRQAFADQRFGSPIIGSQESVLSLTSDDLHAFIKGHYHPQNITIGVSGLVNPKEVLATIEECFGMLGKSTLSPFQRSQPKYTGGELRIVRHETQHSHMLLSFPAPNIHDDATYAVEVLSVIAGGSMSSRLFKEIRENRGLAYSISSDAHFYDKTGMFAVYASADKENIPLIIRLVSEQLRDMIHNISDDELNRAKLQLKSSLLMAQERSLSRAEKAASDFLIFNRYIPLSEIVEHIDKVDKASIATHINNMFFNPSHTPTLALVGQMPDINYDTVKELFSAQ